MHKVGHDLLVYVKQAINGQEVVYRIVHDVVTMTLTASIAGDSHVKHWLGQVIKQQEVSV